MCAPAPGGFGETAYAQTNGMVCRDIAISKVADPDIPILQQAKAE